MLIIWSLIVGANNINAYTKKDIAILDNTVDFGNNNTQASDRVLVYPEGLKVSVLTGRGSDDKFQSLIPLYVETFGEDLITKRLNITKPEFIITTNYDTSAYYYHKFGKDYAVDIKKYITTNYTLIKKDDYAEYYKIKN